jgi:hypothetical protein
MSTVDITSSRFKNVNTPITDKSKYFNLPTLIFYFVATTHSAINQVVSRPEAIIIYSSYLSTCLPA